MKKEIVDECRNFDYESALKLVKADVLPKEEYSRPTVSSLQLLCSPEKERSNSAGVLAAGGSRVGRKSQAVARGSRSKKVMASTTHQ